VLWGCDRFLPVFSKGCALLGDIQALGILFTLAPSAPQASERINLRDEGYLIISAHSAPRLSAGSEEARVSGESPSDLKAVEIVNHAHIVPFSRTTTTAIATHNSEFYSKMDRGLSLVTVCGITVGGVPVLRSR
jgi:hypothetical protein